MRCGAGGSAWECIPWLWAKWECEGFTFRLGRPISVGYFFFNRENALAEGQNVTSVTTARVVGEWGACNLVCWKALDVPSNRQVEVCDLDKGEVRYVSFCDLTTPKNRL